MKTVLSVSDLSFKYPEYSSFKNRTLYKNLTFDINKGETALFLAPPESGKTTLSRIITSLIPRYTGGELVGTVKVSGLDVQTEKPYNLNNRVGIVFQDPEEQILTPLVENEIAFTLESCGLDYEEIEKKVDSAVSFMEIGSLKGKNPALLSGGEKRKLLISCLAASDPELWLLDETLEEIDPEARMKILEKLEKSGKTVLILTSKMLDIYRKYCSRFFLYYDNNFYSDTDAPGKEFMEKASEAGVFLNYVNIKYPSTPCYSPERGRTASSEGGLSKETVNNSGQKSPESETEGTPEEKGTASEEGDTDLSGISSWKRGSRPGAENKIMIRAENIKYNYPESTFSLSVDSFELRKGEITALLGHNGSGKSTFSKILAGLITPDSGEIYLSVSDRIAESRLVTADLLTLNRNAAYLFQNPDYQLFLPTVRDELSFGLKGEKADKNMIKEKVDSASELFRLEHPDTPPALMSYGARKRLQAAIYYLLEKKIILIDEADSGLSFNDYSSILEKLDSSRAEHAVLVITHDVKLAAKIADRIVMMKEGKLITDNPEKEFDRLVNLTF